MAITLISLIVKNITKPTNQEIQQSSNEENIVSEENDDDLNNIDESNNNDDLVNYIEIDMPNLIGKTFMDIVYNYNLKDDILEQLWQKDLEGTTYNLNTLKYLGDGSICIKGSYIIEGYGYEVESQKPAAGTKIKLLNDGEGNVSLEEDIYLYIKGGGATEKINIDRDLEKEEDDELSEETSTDIIDNSNSNENDNVNETETKEKIYIHTAQKGCTLLNPSNTSKTVQYKYKCDYCGEIGKYQYNCDPLFYGGTYETNFKCNSCNKSNIVKISTVEQYK